MNNSSRICHSFVQQIVIELASGDMIIVKTSAAPACLVHTVDGGGRYLYLHDKML